MKEETKQKFWRKYMNTNKLTIRKKKKTKWRKHEYISLVKVKRVNSLDAAHTKANSRNFLTFHISMISNLFFAFFQSSSLDFMSFYSFTALSCPGDQLKSLNWNKKAKTDVSVESCDTVDSVSYSLRIVHLHLCSMRTYYLLGSMIRYFSSIY